MTQNHLDLIAGTNIDPRSFLSTDYFNHFNEVVMLFGMLPSMPEMLDDIDLWSFQSYCEHFAASSLTFAPLAIELYPHVPEASRTNFERLCEQIHMMIVETRTLLRQTLEEGDMNKFAEIATMGSMQLQGMIDMGGAIVHGYAGSLDQESVNKLF